MHIHKLFESLGKIAPDERKPFCLFVSFVNPHDVWVYPKHWNSAGYKHEKFANVGISLPDNYHDDLSTKPSVQKKAREAFNQLVDSKVNAVLGALDQAGLTEDTIIIRTADHGELGLSHGMREKAYTVYEEMIHIPLII